MSKHLEDNYLYHFTVTFDMKKNLFYIDKDLLLSLEGIVWDEKKGKWLSLPKKQEGFYNLLNTVLHNGLQESNQFVIDAIKAGLEKEDQKKKGAKK